MNILAPVAVAFSATLWLAYFQIRQSGSDLLPKKKTLMLPWGVLDIWVVFTVMIVFQAVAISFANLERFSEYSPAEKTELVFNSGAIARLLTLISLVVYFVVRHRATLADLGLNLKTLKFDWIYGTVGFFMIVPMVLLIQYVLVQYFPYHHPTVSALKNNPSPGLIFACIFAAVIAAPLIEEFVFRVVLQGGIQSWINLPPEKFQKVVFGGRDDGINSESFQSEECEEDSVSTKVLSKDALPSEKILFRFRAAIPIIASSLIFAGFHIGQGPAPIPLFFLSIGLGYLYYRTQSIVASWIVHFMLNAWSAGVLLFPQLS